jgi:phenylalanine-4-hydroxylase
MDWILLAQGREEWRAVTNRVLKLWVSKNIRNFLSGLATVSISRSTQFHAVSLLLLRFISISIV